MKSIPLQQAKSPHSQAFRIVLLTVLSLFGIVSCSESEPEPEPVPNPLEIIESMCQYDPNQDVSDSLIMVFDEILDKKRDYNKSKFDVALDSWVGKSIVVEDIPIVSTQNAEDGFDGCIVLQYGDAFEDMLLPVSISIYAAMDKQELSKFDVGDMVKLKGVISSGSSDIMSYNVHLYCHETVIL